MISIKDYAYQKNISYEAVRQQVKRYEKQLGEHVVKVGRTKYLDEEAVAFLDDKRKKNPVIILEQNKDDELEQLKNENKALLLKVAELQEALLNEKDKVEMLREEKIALLESKIEDAEPKKKKWKFW